MENELKEKMGIYRFLVHVAYSDEPVPKDIINYLEFVVEHHLGMTKYECDQALKMNEDEADRFIRNLSINKKKALFIDASKIAMNEPVKNYNGDVFSLLNSKRLQRLVELNKKYDIPAF